MMNFALAFGDPISGEAVRAGAKPASASIAIFAIAISSGFLINAGYCLYLLGRNPQGEKTGFIPRNVVLTALMGFLWMFGMFFYGLGATHMGPLGTSVGWPLFMTTMVLVANFWGILTGEWRAAGRSAVRFLAAGIVVMIVALVVISLSFR
jgi:L-rhamnose-H+ transport protein